MVLLSVSSACMTYRGVTVQMKPIEHHNPVVGVVKYRFLFFESVIFQQFVNLKFFAIFIIPGKDTCMPNPCQHDGTCLQAHNHRGYHCLCHAGWRGYACERKYENILTLNVSKQTLLGQTTSL